jgi:hypothetical protein
MANKVTQSRDYSIVVGLLLTVIGVIPFVESTIIVFSGPQDLYRSELFQWFQMLRVVLLIWALFSILLYVGIIKLKYRYTLFCVTIVNGIWFFAILLCSIMTGSILVFTMVIMHVIIMVGGAVSLQKLGWSSVVIANVIAISSIGLYPAFSYNSLFVVAWCFFAVPILSVVSLILLALSKDKYKPLSITWLTECFQKILQF